MDVLRKSARKLKIESIKNEHIKEIMGVGETAKINYGVDTGGKEEKRTSKKNVDGRCTSSHGNKTSRSRSVVKQKGMAFGLRKTATAVVGPER
jgi:hypothetical protein